MQSQLIMKLRGLTLQRHVTHVKQVVFTLEYEGQQFLIENFILKNHYSPDIETGGEIIVLRGIAFLTDCQPKLENTRR